MQQQAVGMLYSRMGDRGNRRHSAGYKRKNMCEDVFVAAFGLERYGMAMAKDWDHRWSAFRAAACAHARVGTANQGACEDVAMAEPIRKKPRLLTELCTPWESIAAACHHRVELVGDSLVVIQWARGIWRPNFL
eukprot:TRINITY_DN87720_c0_g1_i1.p1 TRINITY_DN87720_c0_g1~~TRINITY_DN87720_c0_g1_i1.p1  ORF type:complete len:134 (+),score=11.22 TRINITY_DN87720_c0_g1_i1:65-466(+)